MYNHACFYNSYSIRLTFNLFESSEANAEVVLLSKPPKGTSTGQQLSIGTKLKEIVRFQGKSGCTKSHYSFINNIDYRLH